jgi:hypothetical protein
MPPSKWPPTIFIDSLDSGMKLFRLADFQNPAFLESARQYLLSPGRPTYLDAINFDRGTQSEMKR